LAEVDGPYEEIVELTEEEKAELEAIQREQDENAKIAAGFDEYNEMDAAAESKKIEDRVMEKKHKKAEIHLLEPESRTYEVRYAANKGPCGGVEKGAAHYMALAGSRNYF